MKLRQHKREHVKRLRRRIARRRAAELRQQFDKAMDGFCGAMAEAILAPGRLWRAALRQMVRDTVAPLARAVAAAGGLPGGSVGGPVQARNASPFINGQPSVLASTTSPLVAYVDGSQVSAASLIAAGGTLPNPENDHG